jgi:excisionase family DNA binding protein
MDIPDRWLSSKEAAELSTVDLRTRYRLVAEGETTACRFGRANRVKALEVVASVAASPMLSGLLVRLHPSPLAPRVA